MFSEDFAGWKAKYLTAAIKYTGVIAVPQPTIIPSQSHVVFFINDHDMAALAIRLSQCHASSY